MNEVEKSLAMTSPRLYNQNVNSNSKLDEPRKCFTYLKCYNTIIHKLTYFLKLWIQIAYHLCQWLAHFLYTMNVIKTFLPKVLLIKYSLICLQDVFTTMVDMQWRYTLLAFVASFLVSWLIFAVMWWFISYVHGDYLIENINNSTFIPCILANKNFASAFLFSVETQHTIGWVVYCTVQKYGLDLIYWETT